MRHINITLLLLSVIFSAILIGDDNERVVKEKHYPKADGDFSEKWQEKKVGDNFVKDGFYIAWYGNGNIFITGQHKHGKRDGKWIIYSEKVKGQIIEEQNYQEGACVGEWSTWKDGKIDTITVYENRKVVKSFVNVGGVLRPVPIPKQ